jgi:hypothetical protein
MKEEDEIREALEKAGIMYDEFERQEEYMESIGVGVIRETLKWVLEEDEFDTLLEDLREEVEDIE